MNCSNRTTRSKFVGLALLALPGLALADLSATLTLTSDYLFDGVSQTEGDPAIQGSIDYAHESGWYVGVWSSNVHYDADVDYRVEVDYYAGYAGSHEKFGYDFRFARYTYPGTSQNVDTNYNEAMMSLSYDATALTFWRSNNYASANTGSFIWQIEHDIALPHEVNLHLEYDETRTDEDINYLPNGEDKMSHWQVGVSRDLLGTNFDLSYHNHSEDDAPAHVAQPTWVVTVSRTFSLMD